MYSNNCSETAPCRGSLQEMKFAESDSLFSLGGGVPALYMQGLARANWISRYMYSPLATQTSHRDEQDMRRKLSRSGPGIPVPCQDLSSLKRYGPLLKYLRTKDLRRRTCRCCRASSADIRSPPVLQLSHRILNSVGG